MTKIYDWITGNRQSCEGPINIKCNDAIHTEDIQRLKQNIADKSLDVYFDEVFKFVAETPTSVLKDAEVTCITSDQHIKLYSGYERNKYVIRMNTSGEITKSCEMPIIIECGGVIDTESVQRLKRRIGDKSLDVYFDEVFKFFGKKPKGGLENAEVTCITPDQHMPFKLCSGNKSNKYIIRMNTSGEITTFAKENIWKTCEDPIIIECRGLIDTGSVQRLKQRIADKSLDVYFDEVFKFVSKKPTWVLENAEVTCITPDQHMPFKLCSGNKSNKYIIRMNTSGEITTVAKENVWKSCEDPIIIECGGAIDTESVQRLKRRIADKGLDVYFDEVFKFVDNQPSRVLENAEVTCITPDQHMLFKLYSGNKSNKYVIRMDTSGEITTYMHNYRNAPPAPARWKIFQLCEDPIIIECEGAIATEDVYQLKRRIADKSLGVYFDEVFNVVAETPTWVLKDAEITCITSNQHIKLYSGNKSNKYIIRMNTSGEITTVVKENGWKSFEAIDIKCKGAINNENVLQLKQRIADKSLDECFDEILKIVADKPTRDLEDAEVTCVTPDQHIKLYSGNKSNKYVISMSTAGKVETAVKE